MEKNVNSLTMRMIGVVGLGVAVLGLFIAYLQFFDKYAHDFPCGFVMSSWLISFDNLCGLDGDRHEP